MSQLLVYLHFIPKLDKHVKNYYNVIFMPQLSMWIALLVYVFLGKPRLLELKEEAHTTFEYWVFSIIDSTFARCIKDELWSHYSGGRT